ncbi:hypothetical protein [Mesorhizobium marinum]|uniref:hypothetical protein n=1 Tax=Mesorhizobium marinum TaxID=3228790 RepID=UPI003467C19E
MTIAERKAREEEERRNPWRQLSEATPDGSICEMRRSDMTGLTELGRARFFLHDDGHWYRIDPPSQAYSWDRLTEFRPTGHVLSEDRRKSVVRRATLTDMDPARRKRPYQLYWRADDAGAKP